ncbi:hypothetical protein A3Q56_04733 [Intoshia linei]|uniref:VPS10 domain-containing protein n=1 Tax=Intoshia linei TaxID=1819745 RepID=A0A177B1M8_9BILA|nr:hypothetical protein A3Q56_04733 [Intoshia linei]
MFFNIYLLFFLICIVTPKIQLRYDKIKPLTQLPNYTILNFGNCYIVKNEKNLEAYIYTSSNAKFEKIVDVKLGNRTNINHDKKNYYMFITEGDFNVHVIAYLYNGSTKAFITGLNEVMYAYGTVPVSKSLDILILYSTSRIFLIRHDNITMSSNLIINKVVYAQGYNVVILSQGSLYKLDVLTMKIIFITKNVKHFFFSNVLIIIKNDQTKYVSTDLQTISFIHMHHNVLPNFSTKEIKITNVLPLQNLNVLLVEDYSKPFIRKYINKISKRFISTKYILISDSSLERYELMNLPVQDVEGIKRLNYFKESVTSYLLLLYGCDIYLSRDNSDSWNKVILPDETTCNCTISHYGEFSLTTVFKTFPYHKYMYQSFNGGQTFSKLKFEIIETFYLKNYKYAILLAYNTKNMIFSLNGARSWFNVLNASKFISLVEANILKLFMTNDFTIYSIDENNLKILKYKIDNSLRDCKISKKDYTAICGDGYKYYTKNETVNEGKLCLVDVDKLKTKRNVLCQCHATDYKCALGYKYNNGTCSKPNIANSTTPTITVCLGLKDTSIDSYGYEKIYNAEYYQKYCYADNSKNRIGNFTCAYILKTLPNFIKNHIEPIKIPTFMTVADNC